jgi:hypothetical protein
MQHPGDGNVLGRPAPLGGLWRLHHPTNTRGLGGPFSDGRAGWSLLHHSTLVVKQWEAHTTVADVCRKRTATAESGDRCSPLQRHG